MGDHMTAENTVVAVTGLDLDRYLGTWFEIGRLPLRFEDDDATDVTATYSLNEDGAVVVDNRCLDEDGVPTGVIGAAAPEDDDPARLRVTFLPEGLRWIPFTKADYWVLRIADDYGVALVGTPDHRYLWLLSRTPALAADIQADYLATARAQGFDLAEWIRTPQSGNRVTDAMLADADRA